MIQSGSTIVGLGGDNVSWPIIVASAVTALATAGMWWQARRTAQATKEMVKSSESFREWTEAQRKPDPLVLSTKALLHEDLGGSLSGKPGLRIEIPMNNPGDVPIFIEAIQVVSCACGLEVGKAFVRNRRGFRPFEIEIPARGSLVLTEKFEMRRESYDDYVNAVHRAPEQGVRLSLEYAAGTKKKKVLVDIYTVSLDGVKEKGDCL